MRDSERLGKLVVSDPDGEEVIGKLREETETLLIPLKFTPVVCIGLAELFFPCFFTLRQ